MRVIGVGGAENAESASATASPPTNVTIWQGTAPGADAKEMRGRPRAAPAQCVAKAGPSRSVELEGGAGDGKQACGLSADQNQSHEASTSKSRSVMKVEVKEETAYEEGRLSLFALLFAQTSVKSYHLYSSTVLQTTSLRAVLCQASYATETRNHEAVHGCCSSTRSSQTDDGRTVADASRCHTRTAYEALKLLAEYTRCYGILWRQVPIYVNYERRRAVYFPFRP